jgi:hypothetical protein
MHPAINSSSVIKVNSDYPLKVDKISQEMLHKDLKKPKETNFKIIAEIQLFFLVPVISLCTKIIYENYIIANGLL